MTDVVEAAKDADILVFVLPHQVSVRQGRSPSYGHTAII